MKVYKYNTLINQCEFDALNRREKAFNYEINQTSTYRYNGLGHRTGKTIGAKHIEDVLDITKQYHNLLQRTEGNETTAYTWDTNLLLANGNPYLIDDLGSPIRFGDEAYSYDEFGFSPTSATQPFSFTGYQTDEVAGTLYAQAREYTPQIGRFAGEDTVRGFTTVPLTLNRYSYCWNTPLNFVDLDGMLPNVDVMAGANKPANAGVSYIFYDPNIFGGHGNSIATSQAESLAEYHGYRCVSQVTLVPMPNSTPRFINFWNNHMSYNVDTVILFGHANPDEIRLHSVLNSEGEYDISATMARLTRNHLQYLNTKNIETILLLGCNMAGGDSNFARDMALLGFAQRIIASYELIWLNFTNSSVRSTGWNEIEWSWWDRLMGRAIMYAYPYPDNGFKMFSPDGTFDLIGNFFNSISELLKTADRLVDCTQ